MAALGYFGMKSPMMQTADGQIEESYSISAGLDFPSVGPQHAFLNSTGRADYVSITDDEALDAFKALSRHEGIIPALESSHALAHALKMMRENPEKSSCWWLISPAAATKTFSPYMTS